MGSNRLRRETDRAKKIKCVPAIWNREKQAATRGQQALNLFEPENQIGHVLDHMMCYDQVESRRQLLREIRAFHDVIHRDGSRKVSAGIISVHFDQLFARKEIEILHRVSQFLTEGRIIEGADLQNPTRDISPVTAQKITPTLRDFRQHPNTIKTGTTKATAPPLLAGALDLVSLTRPLLDEKWRLALRRG